jgi:hypothetical protein
MCHLGLRSLRHAVGVWPDQRRKAWVKALAQGAATHGQQIGDFIRG